MGNRNRIETGTDVEYGLTLEKKEEWVTVEYLHLVKLSYVQAIKITRLQTTV